MDLYAKPPLDVAADQNFCNAAKVHKQYLSKALTRTILYVPVEFEF